MLIHCLVGERGFDYLKYLENEGSSLETKQPARVLLLLPHHKTLCGRTSLTT